MNAEPPFDPQPHLAGELLELRPLREEDHDALFAVARDPLLWEQHPALDRWKPEVFDALFRESMASGGALVVRDRRSGAVIGSSRFHGHSAERREVEIGWSFLARAYWGGRYNGEMKRLMLAHAFRWVERVIFLVGPANVRSQRALEKIGARRAGTRVDGTGRESVVFEIDRAAFMRA